MQTHDAVHSDRAFVVLESLNLKDSAKTWRSEGLGLEVLELVAAKSFAI